MSRIMAPHMDGKEHFTGFCPHVVQVLTAKPFWGRVRFDRGRAKTFNIGHKVKPGVVVTEP
ncbi:hypothetical protein QDX21_03510 [Auritidibacter ignavus]|uniref:Uncharacterized protein n=1 Tax=Auritidibacter ignavus TaxID=678932 RepID=A0AAJ6AQB7_9MICC|nr:hypothetical protein [Auritidibacter ignavus]WGH93879.1 hypothetical protein QDX21_03510 [Auritidibacter ignavus]